MLRETQTDRETDRVESISTPDQSESGELAPLQWKRTNSDNKMIKKLRELTGIMAHSIIDYSKQVEKDLRKFKRF